MLKLFISMAALFLGVGSSVFAQIEGKVYIDANGNGICDAGERPVQFPAQKVLYPQSGLTLFSVPGRLLWI